MAGKLGIGDRRAEAVLEVIRTRRVVRAFTEDPVSLDDLRRILAPELRVGGSSPSGRATLR